MKVLNERKLKDLQVEFSEKFPYLKLEFIPTDDEDIEHLQTMKSDEEATSAEPSSWEFDGKLNLKTLKEKCLELFGLDVEVLRKSGETWLHTTFSKSSDKE